MNEELLKGLSEEQIEKVKTCKNTEEVLKLAKEEGIALTEEQLEAVSGGCGTTTAYNKTCPKCKSTRMVRRALIGGQEYECLDCGHKYTWHAWDTDGTCF